MKNSLNWESSMSKKATATTSLLTEDEQFRAVARILAAGLRRLQGQATLPTVQNSPESAPNCLEVSEKTVLSVQTG
jgi:hypothetical protein